MKSHVLLLGRVLEDSGIRCCTSTTYDLKTVISRVRREGDSFLTITLPTFAKDLERGLDQGSVDSSLFKGYKKRGRLPVFLQGFTSQVFDAGSGTLLDDPSIDAIHAVRQICYLYHKMEATCSEEREAASFSNYIECERHIRDSFIRSSDPLRVRFERIACLLFGDLFTSLEQKLLEGKLVPKHGPGSTADGILGNAKFMSKVWTERLEEWFPAMEYLYSSPRHYFDAIEDGNGPVWLEPGEEIPVKVISVPKTMKSARIIAMEPVHMQYVQQALMEAIVDGIERGDSLLEPFIGFTDQQPNRDLACEGSITGDLATLDLSEASDRVSVRHVEALTASHLTLQSALMAARSSKADVPGYGVQTILKYASMGSALTFPVEAMVFLAMTMTGIEKELRVPLTREGIYSLAGKVRIYGDDIIVPVEYVRSVVETLEDFGLKVNRDKSFWTGKFRESCGGDYYAGHDVTVVKARRILPTQRKHAQEIVSAVSLRNQLYYSGYWRTAEFLDTWISGIIPFPTVHALSPGLGRHTYLDYEIQRVCPNLQRPLVKAAVTSAVLPKSFLGGPDALLKYFLKRGDEPFADRKHLERAGRPDAVDIKLRWVPPY